MRFHRNVKILLTACFILMSIALISYPFVTPQQASAQTAPSFTFSAVGDYSNNGSTTATLDAIATAAPDFHLALGDLSYGGLKPETAWCDYVKSHVGATFPFELLGGNHDSDEESPGQHINNFVQCLPDRLGNTVGEYGKEYYFDYPAVNPIARFILISPGLTFGGTTYNYAPGSARYNWVSDTIDQARAQGVKWVVVGDHFNCITAGTKTCEMGQGLFDMLVDKKVDLILQGHEHTYQRSKQLAHTALCPSVALNSYNSNCVVDDGADGVYPKGSGPVVLILGTGGVSLYDINLNDPELGYFAKWQGQNITPTYGFGKFTVTDSQIGFDFVKGSGSSFTDSFTIQDTGVPTPTPTPTTIQTTQTLIPPGSVWKYLDNNTRPAGWENTFFNDSTWAQGPAELGYGDGDEATVVSYGGSSNNKYITTYFRKAFIVAGSSGLTNLQLHIKRDDGAVVYLNGTEVFRTNMPTGTITHTTPSVLSIEDETYYTASVPESLLYPETNVVAVEIHQSDNTSSDISFDLSLTGDIPGGSGPTPTLTPTPMATSTPTPTPIATATPTIQPSATSTPTAIPTATPTMTPTPTPIGNGELLSNTSFENGTANWALNVTSPAKATWDIDSTDSIDGVSSAKVIITRSSSPYKVQLRQDGIAIQSGHTYTVSFWAKSSKNRSIESIIQQSGQPYTELFTNTSNLTKNWTFFSYTFTPNVSEPTAFFGLNLGKNTTTVWLDGVSIIEQ